MILNKTIFQRLAPLTGLLLMCTAPAAWAQGASTATAETAKPAGAQPAAISPPAAATPATTGTRPAAQPPVAVMPPAAATPQTAADRPAGPAVAPASPALITGPETVETVVDTDLTTPALETRLRFNFKDVPLDTVLDYLARAAGFAIIREAQVDGRIDVVSHRVLDRVQAVELLNSVLNQKGYAAIQYENTLKIVRLEEAKKKDLPVKVGNDAGKIPKNDEMVTQIIPVKYTNVTQLIKNLEELLPSYASISANESSNAVVLTDTQADIHRMVQIIAALDTSLADISTLKVFMLKHADATELAKLINDLFKTTANSMGNGNNGGGGMMPGMPFPMMFGRRGGGGEQGNSGSDQGSAARASAARITAVADSRTNAVVVSAPNEMLPTIEQLVEQVDTSTEQICEIRVFPLKYADATNMAQLINSIYQPSSSSNSSSSNNNNMPGFMRRFMGGPMMQQTQNTSSRKSQETTVLAVADLRTNAVVVNADKDLMEQVAPMIKQLDNNPAKDRKVYVYSLKYADPQQTASILQGMYGASNGRSTSSSNRNLSQNGVFGSSNQSNSSSSRRSNSRNSNSPTGFNLN